MYVIQDELGLYFAGVACGCVVWKGHWTRVWLYKTEREAYKDTLFYGLEGYEIVYLEEGFDYEM